MPEEDYAKIIVLNCFRNTFLEDLHAGIFPSSATGDYTDVNVVSPYGVIPWNDLSRISDPEMKKLMIEAVDSVYTITKRDDVLLSPPPLRWNKPRIVKRMLLSALEKGGR